MEENRNDLTAELEFETHSKEQANYDNEANVEGDDDKENNINDLTMHNDQTQEEDFYEAEESLKSTSSNGVLAVPWEKMKESIKKILNRIVSDFDKSNPTQMSNKEDQNNQNSLNTNHNHQSSSSQNNDQSEDSVIDSNSNYTGSFLYNSNFNNQAKSRGLQIKKRIFTEYPTQQELELLLNNLSKAPFTVQRICELLLNHQKYYKSKNKFLFSLKKLIDIEE